MRPAENIMHSFRHYFTEIMTTDKGKSPRMLIHRLFHCAFDLICGRHRRTTGSASQVLNLSIHIDFNVSPAYEPKFHVIESESPAMMR
jgi:hypothetical protein